MAERRVLRSDPDFQKLFDLANDLAIAKNPQRWFGLADEQMDVPETERLAIVSAIETQLEEALEEKGESFSAFVEFIESLDL